MKNNFDEVLKDLELEDVKRLSFAHLGRYDLPGLCRILLAEALDEARSNPAHEINTLLVGAVDKITEDDAIRAHILDEED